MAVFVSGSDESAGKNQRDTFFLGGFVGPQDDWSCFLTRRGKNAFSMARQQSLIFT